MSRLIGYWVITAAAREQLVQVPMQQKIAGNVQLHWRGGTDGQCPFDEHTLHIGEGVASVT